MEETHGRVSPSTLLKGDEVGMRDELTPRFADRLEFGGGFDGEIGEDFGD